MKHFDMYEELKHLKKLAKLMELERREQGGDEDLDDAINNICNAIDCLVKFNYKKNKS